MKRWWLVIALMLSVGINAGILVTLAFYARASTRDATAGSTVVVGETPEGGPITGAAGDPLPRGGRPPIIRRMADELGLEGDKRAAFTEVQRTFFDQTLAARSRMARLQHEIRGEVTSQDPDRDALDRLLVELSAAHTDLERAFVTNLLDSRELLDGDQERRFMHFLRRLRGVRGEVERRFRERWRGMAGGERLGPRPRGRRGPGQRFERPPEAPAGAVPEEP